MYFPYATHGAGIFTTICPNNYPNVGKYTMEHMYLYTFFGCHHLYCQVHNQVRNHLYCQYIQTSLLVILLCLKAMVITIVIPFLQL